MNAREDALDLFAPHEAEHLKRYAASAAAYVANLETHPITNEGSAAAAHNMLAEAKRAAKHIDLIRSGQVGPLNDLVRAINGAWRPVLDELAAFEALVKRQLLAWQQSNRERVARETEKARRDAQDAAKRQAEAEERALVAATPEARQRAQGDVEDASRALMVARIAEPMAAPTGIRTEHGTTTTREHWTFRVTDAAQVPREFMAVDERKLRAAVASGVRGGIPGVEVYAEEILSTRVG